MTQVSWRGRPTSPSCRAWSIPYDESANLDRRARSYLQTNCAHCHQFNAGGTANIALGIEVAAAGDADRRRAAHPGHVRHCRRQDHRAGRSGAVGALLPDVEAWRGPNATSRLKPGRRARDADDPRLDRAHARARRTGRAGRELAAEDRDALEALRKPDQLSPERRSSTRSAASRDNPGRLAPARLDRSRTRLDAAQERARRDCANEPERGSPRPVRAIHSRSRAREAAGRRRSTGQASWPSRATRFVASLSSPPTRPLNARRATRPATWENQSGPT